MSLGMEANQLNPNLPSLLQRIVKVRCITRHGKLHIGPTLVQEMPQWTTRHNVGAFRPPLLDGGLNGGDAAVALQSLGNLVLATCCVNPLQCDRRPMFFAYERGRRRLWGKENRLLNVPLPNHLAYLLAQRSFPSPR